MQFANEQANARLAEAARLIALSLDLVAGENEQIIRDYLDHALAALTRSRESLGDQRT